MGRRKAIIVTPTHDLESVAAHYDALAPAYNAGANRYCNQAYAALVPRKLAGCTRLLELGGGSFSHGAALSAGLSVVCDLSAAMLHQGAKTRLRVQADAQSLPFPDANFDGVLSVNLLEHVPDPAKLLAESARVLAPGGQALFITPNGDRRGLLELLERLRLKLPEGPHRFLPTAELRDLTRTHFILREQAVFLACPVLHPRFTRLMDRLCRPLDFGLFQYLHLQRR